LLSVNISSFKVVFNVFLLLRFYSLELKGLLV